MWRVLCKIQTPQASSKTQYNTYVPPSDIFYGEADMSVYQTPQRDLTSVSFAMLPSNEGLYLYGE